MIDADLALLDALAQQAQKMLLDFLSAPVADQFVRMRYMAEFKSLRAEFTRVRLRRVHGPNQDNSRTWYPARYRSSLTEADTSGAGTI